MKWLRHAFAVDSEGPAEPTPCQQPVVDWLCLQIAKRKLATPGLIFLEMCRPLNFFSAQSLHFLQPSVWAIASHESYADFVQLAEFLEHRGSTEYLAQRIEYFEAEMTRQEQAGRSVRSYVRDHLDGVRAAASAWQSNIETATHDGVQGDE